ncbi:MAG: heavy metal translocating P-type ATPase metal-binding domain-containing protein [Bacteroidota bacterium]
MTTVTATTTCLHCNDEAGDHPVIWNENIFCCEGCKMVYEILQENELSTFYQLDENPGFSLKSKQQKDYTYLDDPETLSKVVNFQDENFTRVNFTLPQIHCASCIWLLEHLYRVNPHIVQSKVNFLKKEIDMTFNTKEISLSEVANLLDKLGYSPDINLQSIDEKQNRSANKTIIYQLGIAGFCFGNVMLLSFPEYLGLDETIDPQFTRFFGLLNIILSIPVLIFSARDYLISAVKGLRFGQFNLDMPIALGIISLFGRSVYEILTHTGAGYLDSFTGLIFFLLIGKWFQQRVYNHLSFERDYKSYFPLAAMVLKAGKTISTPVRELRPGDRVLIKNQEIIPADGILINGDGNIDYSFVTGESHPVTKASGSRLFAGGRHVGGNIEIELTQKTDQSYLIRLWDHDVFHNAKEGETTRIANLAGKLFTIAILIIAFSTLTWWLQFDTAKAINAFTAVLIIACPCAVALSIPFTLSNIARIMARNKLFLRNTNAVENLSRLDNIVFDKTGTLTTGMEQNIHFEGQSMTGEELEMVYSLVNQSNHPKSRMLAKHLGDLNRLHVIGFAEIESKGITGIVRQATIHVGSAKFIEEIIGHKPDNKHGLFIAIDHQVRGHFLIKQAFRDGVEEVVKTLNNTNDTALLSGDNDKDENRFIQLFPDKNRRKFFQSPEMKLDFIHTLQKNGKTVMMVGDGLNDAGALQMADIGMVISDDTNNFSPACDAILDARAFDKLPALIQLSRGGIKIIYLAFLLSLTYNIIGLSFAVQALLSPVIAAILMPLSSITVVIFGVSAGNFLARKIGLHL